VRQNTAKRANPLTKISANLQVVILISFGEVQTPVTLSSRRRHPHEPKDNPDWLLPCVVPLNGERSTCQEAKAKLRQPRYSLPSSVAGYASTPP